MFCVARRDQLLLKWLVPSAFIRIQWDEVDTHMWKRKWYKITHLHINLHLISIIYIYSFVWLLMCLFSVWLPIFFLLLFAYLFAPCFVILSWACPYYNAHVHWPEVPWKQALYFRGISKVGVGSVYDYLPHTPLRRDWVYLFVCLYILSFILV